MFLKCYDTLFLLFFQRRHRIHSGNAVAAQDDHGSHDKQDRHCADDEIKRRETDAHGK